MKKQSKLIQSASIILTLLPTSNQILMLKREAHISFSNVLAFPGGACDKQDKIYSKNTDFTVYAKLTAIRELYEETGILLLPPIINLQLRKKIDCRQIALTEISYAFLGQIWSNDFNLIRPMARFATPQHINSKRFDCIFYIAHESVVRINYRSKDNSLQNLAINLGESSKYFWEQPITFLKMSTQKGTSLAPPQKIIITCLTGMSLNFDIGGSFLKNVWQIPESVSLEPFLFQITSEASFLLFGDSEYQKSMIQNEPESQSKHQILHFMETHKERQKKGGKRRILFNKNFMSSPVFETNGSQMSILRYMNSASSNTKAKF